MRRRSSSSAGGARGPEIAAVSRALTLIERGDPEGRRFLDALASPAIRARRVLVTGPPGVGKSSLLRGVVRLLRRRDERVAVIACDPASPTTSGAFLGDRVRWAEIAEDPGVFIRSVAVRERGGVLAVAVESMADLLERAGFRWVFLETVGAGQTDDARSGGVQTVVLVLSPGSGDEMQMLKAGILETADIHVVNKVDLPGGERWHRQLEEILGLEESEAPTGAGVEELVAALESRG